MDRSLRLVPLGVARTLFPRGKWVLSSTETDRYVGQVNDYVLNTKGIVVVRVGFDRWASFVDELTPVDAARARALVDEDGPYDAGYNPALFR